MAGNSLLTKTKYIKGLQCPRLLWTECNAPERLSPTDAATQYAFDQGDEVGQLARQLFPGGIEVPYDDFKTNLALTRDYLPLRKPLFEAGMAAGRLYSRMDILSPANSSQWDIFEVKSSTSVKEVYLDDVSFQKTCWEDGGVAIRKCFLIHINNRYVRNGQVDPWALFAWEDITVDVDGRVQGIRGRIARLLKVMRSVERPAADVGPHCHDPYSCSLLDECMEGLPEHHIFTLCGGSKCFQLYRDGIVDIASIPSNCTLNEKQQIQKECVVTGLPHIDTAALALFLDDLEYPFYYLDFETFYTTIPLFDGTRPYQKIPFQFSLHVQGNSSLELRQYAFLASGTSDPRPALLASLRRLLVNCCSSVLSYNTGFEKTVLRDLGCSFPSEAGWLQNATTHLVDLYAPFRNFHYYHPAQKGGTSLKDILPVLAGLDYNDLAIGDGTEAGPAYLAIAFGKVPVAEASKVRDDLLAYCRMDSAAMVAIVSKLKSLVGDSS